MPHPRKPARRRYVRRRVFTDRAGGRWAVSWLSARRLAHRVEPATRDLPDGLWFHGETKDMLRFRAHPGFVALALEDLPEEWLVVWLEQAELIGSEWRVTRKPRRRKE